MRTKGLIIQLLSLGIKEYKVQTLHMRGLTELGNSLIVSLSSCFMIWHAGSGVNTLLFTEREADWSNFRCLYITKCLESPLSSEGLVFYRNGPTFTGSPFSLYDQFLKIHVPLVMGEYDCSQRKAFLHWCSRDYKGSSQIDVSS